MDKTHIENKIEDLAINQAIKDLVDAKSRDGRVKGKLYKDCIDNLHEYGIKISIDALYKRVTGVYNKLKKHQEITVHETFSTLSSLSDDATIHGSSFNDLSINLAGCPRGTTDEKKRQQKKQYSDCIKSICKEYSCKFTKRKAAGTHVPSSFLDKLIERKKSEFKISTNIPKGTVSEVMGKFQTQSSWCKVTPRGSQESYGEIMPSNGDNSSAIDSKQRY